MPDSRTHLDQFNHNKNFIKFGISHSHERFDDWEVTVCFYACIHLIEAVLEKQYKLHSENHHNRDEHMSDCFETFKNCRHKYTSLKNLAWTARYVGIINISKDAAFNAQTYLEDVESDLRSYI